jgi:CheY-like chemotaxis protein/anti-sigma regulatory factor (Ser/Thr protein kinase)
MAAIGSIAAGVAHDLSAPVAAALAALEEAARVVGRRAAALGEDGPVLERAVADAREAGEQIRAVARDLRTFARADHGGATADVVEVLESAARMAAHELRGRAKVVRDYGQVPRVAAAPSRLGQVLLNLIVNAAQAIRRGAPERNEVRLRTSLAPDGRVAIDVEDTGAGMTPEVRGRLFTPFFTTKPDGVGTGLGLSICSRIVEGLGGEIGVSSEPGRGTTFRVLVPAAAGPRAAPETAAATPRDAGEAALVAVGGEERPRVLVVDDEEAVHRAMARLLGKTCDVSCEDGTRALRRLEAGERFELVLCDVSMAGLSGIDLYVRLRALDPDQAGRVVFMSGGAFGPQVREFFAETAAPVLDKASSPDELRAAVAERLRALGRAPGA